MKFGLPISFMLHGMAVFGGMFLWSGAAKELTQVNIIPLEIVTVSDVSNVKAARKKPPKELPKEPPKEDVAPPLVNPPKPIETSPDGLLPADDTPPPEEPAERPKDELKDKPPAFNLDAFSDMVDEARTQSPDTSTQTVLGNEAANIEMSDKNIEGVGAGTGATISVNDYIQSKMKPCWSVDKGAVDYQNLRVVVRLGLDNKGEITELKVINAAQIIASSNNSWRAARDRVITGLRECAPYDGLQMRNFEEWKTMKLNFQPGEM